MAKPWGRIELDYINHDKFKALNANAMCLWHEGKNYCDIRLTDGLIPTTTAKHFRWYSKKALAFLLVSAGPKTGTTEQYAPLWDVIEGFGYKMHDYLEHNDGRDVVLARIAKSEAVKQADADRKADARAAKEEKRIAGLPRRTSDRTDTGCPPDIRPDIDRTSEACPDPVQGVSASIQKQQQHQKHLQAVPSEQPQSARGSKRPLFTGQRLTVFEWFLDRATQVLGPHLDDFHIDEWFYTLDAQAVASGQVIPSRDSGAWLESQLLAEAKRRGLPIAGSTKRLTEDAATMDAGVLEILQRKGAIR